MSIPWSKYRPPADEARLPADVRARVQRLRRQMYSAATAGSQATVIGLGAEIRRIKRGAL